MVISESQLSTWSNQGSVTNSAIAYNSVKTAIYSQSSSVKNLQISVYLQGSYRNHTNIYGESDVDIIVQLDSSFDFNDKDLPPEQKLRHEATYSDATYLYSHFYKDVLAALISHFGSERVEQGKKSIKVQTGPGRMTADVVPALHFRDYVYFQSDTDHSFVDGISFYDSNGDNIRNYPKLHIENGESKNSSTRTNGWYKPAVRIFKNARTFLIDRGQLDKNVAPSYFVECLVYNIPDEVFGSNYSLMLEQGLEHLKNLPFDKFTSKNEIIPLFGNSNVQWNKDDASTVILALDDLQKGR